MSIRTLGLERPPRNFVDAMESDDARRLVVTAVKADDVGRTLSQPSLSTTSREGSSVLAGG